MKYALVLITLLFLSSCVNINWTREDTARHAVFTGLHVIDYCQTRNIVNHPNKYYEINPILGEHPSQSAVDISFLTTYGLVTGVAILLPPKYRAPLQYITIGMKGGLVLHNLNVGITLDW